MFQGSRNSTETEGRARCASGAAKNEKRVHTLLLMITMPVSRWPWQRRRGGRIEGCGSRVLPSPHLPARHSQAVACRSRVDGELVRPNGSSPGQPRAGAERRTRKRDGRKRRCGLQVQALAQVVVPVCCRIGLVGAVGKPAPHSRLEQAWSGLTAVWRRVGGAQTPIQSDGMRSCSCSLSSCAGARRAGGSGGSGGSKAATAQEASKQASKRPGKHARTHARTHAG